MNQDQMETLILPPWQVVIDRSSNSKGSRIGAVLASIKAKVFEQSFILGFKTTNIVAKYKVHLEGIRLAKNLWAKSVEIHSD